jgi:hypothetical protein
MSLVAFLHNYGYPLLVGDLLVSRPPLPNEPITAQTLPTGKREIAGIGGTKLRRKLYIINDRLAAGVVGEINTGGAFVRALKARFAAGSPDAGEVTNFVRAHVEALNDPTRLNAIVIHAGAETNGQIPFNVGNCNLGVREETTRYAGEIIAIGSGMNEFVEYAQRAVPLGDSKDLRSALGRILSLLAGLLIDEAGGVRDLSSAWGAGFELLAFDQGRFQRFDSVTYVQ